ncbi:MAG: hypothetical protein ACT4PE_05595 [Candidatus Eiseniibacteriota bacterium]
MDNDTLKALGIVLALYLLGRWLAGDTLGRWTPRINKGGKR